MSEQGKTDAQELMQVGGVRLPPKLVQVIESRKVWAGVIGVVTTLTLWWAGEIEGTRAIEAMTWVLGIFIGSVALEDGMTRLFSSLAHAVASHEGDSSSQTPRNDKTNEGNTDKG